MTATTLTPFLDLVRLAEADWAPSLHPRGPDGRFTHSFARLMTDDQKGHARRAAAAFKPKQGVNTPEGARAYLPGLGQTSPAVTTYFGGGHREVNQALRAGSDNYPGVKAMDAAMTPLPDDIVVTRRVPLASLGDVGPEQLVNFRVADAGYTAGRLTPMQGGPNDVVMHIAVPKGTPAAINPEDGSIVLHRGLEMSILHAAPNQSGGKYMFLIAVPHKDGDGGDGGDLPNLGGRDGGRGGEQGSGNAPADGRGTSSGGQDGGQDGTAGPAPDGTGGAEIQTQPEPARAAPPPAEPAPAAGGRDTTGGGTGDRAAAPKTGDSSGAVLKRTTASASEDPTSLGEADPELRDAMHQAFDGEFGGVQMQVDDQVSQVYVDGDGRTVVRAEGYVRKDGKIVGSFRRMLYPDTGEVHNDTFALRAGEQGSGVAQQFAQHSEPILAKMGMTHATVSATAVGGYAWRRYGWNPDNPAAAGDVPSRLRSVLGQYDLSAADKQTVQGWLAAFSQPDQSKWPTPSEIGDFGKGKYDKGQDGRTIWPGKDVLVGSSWQGLRDLNTGTAA